VTFQVFAANDEKRAAVERQLFIIGEAAARLPDDWKQRLPEVPWRKIVGLRNLLAHGYWVIDAEELWTSRETRCRSSWPRSGHCSDRSPSGARSAGVPSKRPVLQAVLRRLVGRGLASRHSNVLES
jgi:hypothetical protein